MNCKKCNTEIAENVNYCPTCGEKITTQSADASNPSEKCSHNQSNNYQHTCSHYQPIPPNYIPPQPPFYPPQSQITDPGHLYALLSFVLGILSLFALGPIGAILSLYFAKQYEKIGSGANSDKISTGKICSWISIGLVIAVLIFYAVFFLGITPALINSNYV